MEQHNPCSRDEINPVFLAQSRLRRRRFDDANQICSDLLTKNPYDQAVWYLKVRATTLKNWIDDTELEEEGAGDILLDDNAMQAVPRPGTSLARPQTSAAGISQAIRPVSSSGRPMTGFARPGTTSRPLTGSTAPIGGAAGASGRVSTALKGSKPGTARPTTTSGRFVRLGTASMAAQPGGPFINVARLDLEKYAARPHLARVLCDYILYNDHSAKAASVLCAAATEGSSFGDWWWKLRLGICYYNLGLFSLAIKQLESSLRSQEMVVTALHLNKAYLRLDQPLSAVNMFARLSESHADDIALLLGQARVHDALHDLDRSMALYKSVLHLDASNVESMACMASYHFYADQPEIALRFYRRLLLMGVTNAELWNNLGLCCFYASQYDMTLRCFEQALVLSDDSTKADIWYNIGQVAIGMGDTNLAYQAFKVAVSVDGNHAESFNNLGVLESQRGNVEAAANYYRSSQELGAALFEPFYNSALAAFKGGHLERSFEQVNLSLTNFPDHSDSQELLRLIRGVFCLA